MLATTFKIEEIGDSPNETGLYSVDLRGRALPYKSFELTGTQRAEITFYQGNPVGSAQVMGPEEKPTTLHGMWKYKFIYGNQPGPASDGVAVVSDGGAVRAAADPMDLCKVVDAIRKRGRLVKVTWDEIVREGILTQFVQKWQERQDVEWEMEFSWTSQGQSASPLGTSNMDAASSTVSTLQRAFDDFDSAMNDVNNYIYAATDFMADVQAAITKIGSSITTVVNTASATVSYAEGTPNSVEQNLIGNCVSVEQACLNFYDTITSTPPFQTTWQPSTTTTPTPPPATSASTKALQFFLFKQAALSAKAMARTARQQRQLLLRKVDPTLLTVVYAKSGQDLRAISLIVYGTSDQAQALKAYNRFSTSLIRPGTMVLCPQLTASTQP